MRPLLFLFLALLVTTARAQAPVWAAATSGNNNQPPPGGTSQARGTVLDPATGNVYVTGTFTGSVTFGTTRLVSTGGSDVFLAKWDAAAGAWTSATSGGGTNGDQGNSLALSSTGGVTSLYVTGYFQGSASLAGTALSGTGSTDLFVAKYTDNGSGLAGAGAVSGGGTGADYGSALAVLSTGTATAVYVTGGFTSGSSASVAGTTLAGAGGTDLFLAKYLDAGNGLAAAGALSGGGPGSDYGSGLAVIGAGAATAVYVAGAFTSGGGASVAGTALAGAGGQDLFVAKYFDTSGGLTNLGGGAVSGGGSGTDYASGLVLASDGSSTYLYVTGTFQSGTGASVAGSSLAGAGGSDAFVAKYADAGSGLAAAGALPAGGTGTDYGYALGIGQSGSTTTLYLTGGFTSGSSASLAGTALAGAGDIDLYVARYTDAGSGLTGAGAVAGGGAGTDVGYGLTVGSAAVYAYGSVGTAAASLGSPGLLAPASSAALLRLDPATLGWQRAEGPLQGGTSTILATAADPATGSVYVAGYFSGTVGFGNQRLVSAGGTDAFVAKWDPAAATYAAAASGGGTGDDRALALGVAGGAGTAAIYVTGYFASSSGASIAGTSLPGAGDNDVFVAKYLDAGGSLSGAGALGDGGTGSDLGNALTLYPSGNTLGVYVAGQFASGSSARIAGTGLVGAGGADLFVAKYTDAGQGLTTTGGGAVSGGGTANDFAYGVGVGAAGSTLGVYVAGTFASGSNARIAGTTLPGLGGPDMFVAKFVDTGAGGLTAAGGGALSGGDTSADGSAALAVVSASGVASVYVTGYFTVANLASIAGSTLNGRGGQDAFVAKYTDAGNGLTGARALSGGGTGTDFGLGLAVTSSNGTTSVYVAGAFGSGTGASFAGTALTGAGGTDLLLAKYTDVGSGLRTTGGGAVSGGGTGTDYANAVALVGQQVYAAGYVTPSAGFGTVATLANPTSTMTNVLARATDPSLPLPVRLVAFSATAADPAARLAWTTASETGSARFEVERSRDGVRFALVGAVSAAGHSAVARSYAYLDAPAPAGTSYYRLRQVDQDGTSTYSPVRSLTLGRPGSLALYPNPAAQGTALLTGAAPGQWVRVLDTLGRVAATATADTDGAARLTGLAPGLYSVQTDTSRLRLAVE